MISAIIQTAQELAEQMAKWGIHIHLTGGETADVGDIVRTIDVGYTAFARLARKDLIVNNIQSGDVVVGLASYGQASYEKEYNGGMGSNGLTSARHDVLSRDYAGAYPESYDPHTPEEVVYTGAKKLSDPISVEGRLLNVGKLILSPTRTYLPVLKRLLDELRPSINGLIHNTGGGQTKVVKFIENKKVIKDRLLPLPPLFQLIQSESKTPWREMYQVFNMGHRLEVYLKEEHAQRVVDIAGEFNIDAQIIGRVEENEGQSVQIESPYGVFTY